jgi:ferrous iron transport protein B
MLDRFFRVVGLNGKAVIPMILGLGCGSMALLTSRILETKKERIIAALLLSLGIPCSAQLGVTLGLLSGLSWKVSALWVLSISGSLLFVGFIADKVLPGDHSPFIVEIPPLRVPVVWNIITKVRIRIAWYIKEAIPIFVLATAMLFLFSKLHILEYIIRFAQPLVTGMLGLPAKATDAFIMGFLRRDYGAAGLYVLARQGQLDPRQILISTTVITLFVPCITQFFISIKERGAAVAMMIFVFVFIYAFLYGGFLNLVVGALNLL